MNAKTNLSNRGLRPECDADAQFFLSAVYNQRYTSRKVASKFKQSGRSMIEMLGVLAITGVLTVGSIIGYSRAMRRHLLNKQREQISYILSAAETHQDMININTPDLPAALVPIFKTFGWIPEEMIKDGTQYIYDAFYNKISITFSRDSSLIYMSIHIANSNNSHDQCVNLYQTIKNFGQYLYNTKVHRTTDDFTTGGNGYFGDKVCETVSRRTLCISDLTNNKISQLCQFCNSSDACTLYLFWQ